MKKLLLFLVMIGALGAGAYFTPQGKKYSAVFFNKGLSFYKSFFLTEIYPGQLIMEVPESTGALAPEYYRRYTYTYEAKYDGKTYNQETAQFIIQKTVENHLAGGHNIIKLFTSSEAPGGVTFSLYQNVFDSNGILIEKKYLDGYRIID